MSKLHLDSERVSPTGNISSQGIINQLGRPNLDSLAVLMREAVQNSWDARSSNDQPVHFGISGWTLDLEKKNFLKNVVFSNNPPETSLSLGDLLKSKSPVNVLALYDRGTTGLGGPTRADEISAENEARDFVDFLRNVGQPPDKKFSGGTYGYGKASFYRSSLVHTICVHTRCKYKGQIESRFIASALGQPFEANKFRYTGRHWWGRKKGGIVEPILGEEADDIAYKLGMPQFSKEELGSTILIIQPTLIETASNQNDDVDALSITIKKAAEHLVWNFWPKMLKHNKKKSAMSFSVQVNDQALHIPDPSEFGPTKPFVQAMARIKNATITSESPFKNKIIEIISQRPSQKLGTLSLQVFPMEQIGIKVNESEDTDKIFTHHVALMRKAELVVRYFVGPPLSTDTLGYAGIFITEENVDSAFANSEPPTHDDWIPDSLDDKTHKTLVRTALRNILKETESFSQPMAIQGNTAGLVPLGAFATKLANSIFPTISGGAANLYSQYYKGAETSNPGGAGKPKNDVSTHPNPPQNININQSDTISPPPTYTPKHNDNSQTRTPQNPILGKARIKVISEGDFVQVNGVPSLQVSFTVKHGENSSGSLVKVMASAIIDGGQTETDPPIGASQAKVLMWIDPNGINYNGSDEIFISAKSEGVWNVIVSTPEDIVLGIDFKAEARP